MVEMRHNELRVKLIHWLVYAKVIGLGKELNNDTIFSYIFCGSVKKNNPRTHKLISG